MTEKLLWTPEDDRRLATDLAQALREHIDEIRVELSRVLGAAEQSAGPLGNFPSAMRRFRCGERIDNAALVRPL
jgi:hypothetical protein